MGRKKKSLHNKSYCISINNYKQVEKFVAWENKILQVKNSIKINTDNYILVPIKSIKKIGAKNVYDLQVANNNSFIVNKLIVHNCGFAMGKFNGWEEFKKPNGGIERRPKIYIDYMEQIKAGPKGEILFSDIRKKIYRLREIGWNIALVTYDGFQSIDSIQTLRDEGFNVELLSVDKTTIPYYTLKEALIEGRLDFYNYPQFVLELQQLEEVNGRKIDHARNGSKDVADAVAGVCFHCGKRIYGSGILGAS